MPIGSYNAIPLLASELIFRQPRRVLDLGMGFGMLGAAVREWLDLGVQPWRTHLVGVEIWSHYRNPMWQLYDVVYLRSIEEHLASEQSQYDMVLLGDVIEHFEESEAIEILGQVQRVVAPNGSCLVITPAVEMQQGPAHGNPYETHRSVWNATKLRQHGFEILLSVSNTQVAPATPTTIGRRIRH